MGAKIARCKTIIAVGGNQESLELAKDLGATHIINRKQVNDIPSTIAAITKGGANYAIDTSGYGPLIEDAIKSTCYHGKIIALCADLLCRTLLCRTLLCQTLGVKNNSLLFAKNKNNKPYLVDYSLHFNLTHSFNWAACAISIMPVGIDIESIAEPNIALADMCFAKPEIDLLNSVPKDQISKTFFTIWTLKESYMKADGRGLNIPLDSIYFSVEQNKISAGPADIMSQYCFKVFRSEINCVCSLCYQTTEIAEPVIINIEDLMSQANIFLQ